MGVIQRQSIKNSIVNYLGVAIGALSVMFIYPLNMDLYGSIQVWIASAALLVPVLSLGTPSLVQKFFPYFRDNGYNGFLKMILTLTFVVLIISSTILYFSKGIILNANSIPLSKRNNFNNALNIIYPLGVLMVFTGIFRTQSANFRRIVIPDLIQKLGFKIYLPIIFISTVWGYTTKGQVKLLLIAFHIGVIVFFVFYLKHINAFDVKGNLAIKQAKAKKKEMGEYMGFNVLAQIGHLLAYQIDKVMIGAIITSLAAGVYTVFLFLATVIEIPTKSIYQISSPIVSQAFKKNDLSSIDKLYKKSSLNLLVIGVFIFSIIWLNMENIFQIMSNGDDMRPYKYLFLFLGLAKLMDMLTSINGFIILYSKYYKYNLLFIGIMAVSNIISNFFFINWYGIIGAGIATAISISTYNIIRSGFIWYRLKMHPFSTKMIVLLILLSLTFVISINLKLSYHPILNIILISGAYTSIYISIIYYFIVSEEINKLIDKLKVYILSIF